jgi:hypothetical protein
MTALGIHLTLSVFMAITFRVAALTDAKRSAETAILFGW